MKGPGKRPTSIAVVICAASLAFGVRAQSAADGIAYRFAPGWEGGAVVIANPYGGAYEYSNRQVPDGRVAQRFVLSRPSRDDYSLFSAEEEEALWGLREQLRRERERLAMGQQGAIETSRLRRPARPRRAIDWPRVVVDGDKTCVPTLAFSEAPDWKSHLVCWLRGEKRVQ